MHRVVSLLALCGLPLGTMIAFIFAKTVFLACAVSALPGSSVVRAMPAFRGVEIIRTPPDQQSSPARSGVTVYAVGDHVVRNVITRGAVELRALLTLDPSVVGAPRTEAIRFLAAAYAAYVLVVGTSLMLGLHAGGWACRLALRPGYWTRPPIRGERRAIYGSAVLPGVLWAYPAAVLLSAACVLLFPTIDSWFTLYNPPPLGWVMTLLCAPTVPAALAVVRHYRNAVHSGVGARDHLCDCDYECPPGVVCPECGYVTRGLPARVHWRWRVQTGAAVQSPGS